MLTLLLVPLATSRRTPDLSPPGAQGAAALGADAVAAPWRGAGSAPCVGNPGCPGPVDSRPPLVLLDASLSMTADSGQWQAAIRHGATRSGGCAGSGTRVRGPIRPRAGGGATSGPRWPPRRRSAGGSWSSPTGNSSDVPDIPAELLASAGIVVLPRQRGRTWRITEVSAPARATVGDTIAVTADVQLTGADSAETADGRPPGRDACRSRREDADGGTGATVPVRVTCRERGASPWARSCFAVRHRERGRPRASRRRPDRWRWSSAARRASSCWRAPGTGMHAFCTGPCARWPTCRSGAMSASMAIGGGTWTDFGRFGRRRCARRRGARTCWWSGARRAAWRRATGARGLPPAGPTPAGAGGEWYASAAPISPIGLAFLGVPVDSFPPVSGCGGTRGRQRRLGRPLRPGRASRRRAAGRRSADQVGRRREVTIGADGFWRWAFRGGPSGDVYRAMMAATVSWLLAEPDRGSAEARLVRAVVDQGLPVTFERTSDSHACPFPCRGVGWRGAAGHAPLRRRRARVALAAPGHVSVPPGGARGGDRDGRGGHLVARVAPAAGYRRSARAHARGRRRGSHRARQWPWLLRARAAGAVPASGSRAAGSVCAESRVRFPP